MIPDIPAIKKLLDQIETDPKSFDMSDWEGWRDELDEYWDPASEDWIERNECGTSRCAAGWAIWQYAQGHDLIESGDDPLIVVNLRVARHLGLHPHRSAFSQVGSRILGIDRHWFFTDPGEIIPYLRGLVAESEGGPRVL